MTNDIKDGYVAKGRQYNPNERVDVENDSVVERISSVNPSQFHKGLGVKGTYDKLGR
jgi:hypothetical protein